MLSKPLTLPVVLIALTACATSNDLKTDETGSDCPPEVKRLFESIDGDWALSIEADEGWTGYGSSRIEWASSLKCGVSEITNAVYNQESDAHFENTSSALLVYDELSETIKVLTSDRRGYTHIGISPVASSLTFEILKPEGALSTRRIQYRDIETDSFEWIWQGWNSTSERWDDRLKIVYETDQ